MSQDAGEKRLFQNWVSVAGGILSVVFFSSILFLIILDRFGHGKNLYVGGMAYLILPAFLTGSLILIPLGAGKSGISAATFSGFPMLILTTRTIKGGR